jgi:hypothetical protein
MSQAKRKDEELSDRAAALLFKGRNDQLLERGAWCQIHRRGYAANHWANGRVEAQDCPRCTAERQWVRKAMTQLRAENVTITGPLLLARAEQLAGKRLHRYKRYDEDKA